jgi:hypothetical protein
MYIALMGPDGLRRATELAILNANYVAARLDAAFPVLYTGDHDRVAHECILDLRPLTAATGVTVDDVAKRLIDFGFHAPTMSFPVAGTLMVEPTESESLAELDRFVDAMLAIREEIAQVERGDVTHDDSPLAVNVSEVFARHPECYDHEVAEVLRTTGDPFGFDLLHYIQTRDESIALNRAPGPFIVISASGMCEAGRVLHHLKNSIDDPKNAILIVGYQAEHTLGRRLVEGAAEVKIFGDPYPRRAEVIVMNEFSAHADRDELLTWVRGFRRTPAQAFVVHGEEAQALPFAAALETEAGIGKALVPRLNESSPL